MDEYLQSYKYPFENFDNSTRLTLDFFSEKKIVPDYIEYLTVDFPLTLTTYEDYENYLPILPNSIKYFQIILNPLNHIKDNDEKIKIFNLINDWIPKNIEYLGIFISEFIISYEDFIISLPRITDKNNIKFIEIDHTDTQDVEYIFYNEPNNPDNLRISKIFQKINDWIPKNVEYLKTSMYIENIHLFQNLKTFGISPTYFGNKYNTNELPENVIRLDIDKLGFCEPLDNLPLNLEVLILNNEDRPSNYCSEYPYELNNLPPGLKILCMPAYNNYDGNTIINLLDLPNSLLFLSLTIYFKIEDKISLNHLPDSLEYIVLNTFDENFLEINKLPKSLKTLETQYKLPENIKNIIHTIIPNLELIDVYDEPDW